MPSIDKMTLNHNAQEESQLEDLLDLTFLLKKPPPKSSRKSTRTMSGQPSRSSTPSFITKSRSKPSSGIRRENALSVTNSIVKFKLKPKNMSERMTRTRNTTKWPKSTINYKSKEKRRRLMRS
jgi:hypothetical protein